MAIHGSIDSKINVTYGEKIHFLLSNENDVRLSLRNRFIIHANHLQVCPVLGRKSDPHDVVRVVLSHLVIQNCFTDAAVVETRLAAADRGTFDASVVFYNPSSWARVILEVSIVTIGSDTSLGRGARAGMYGVNAHLRAREEDKRNYS
jgi:hypothetical protein